MVTSVNLKTRSLGAATFHCHTPGLGLQTAFLSWCHWWPAYLKMGSKEERVKDRQKRSNREEPSVVLWISIPNPCHKLWYFFLPLQAEATSTGPLDLQALVELLLVHSARPNNVTDRAMRSACCEGLRTLERAWPCILAGSIGHLFALCQSERGPAVQSYLLLLLQALQVHARF